MRGFWPASVGLSPNAVAATMCSAARLSNHNFRGNPCSVGSSSCCMSWAFPANRECGRGSDSRRPIVDALCAQTTGALVGNGVLPNVRNGLQRQLVEAKVMCVCVCVFGVTSGKK